MNQSCCYTERLHHSCASQPHIHSHLWNNGNFAKSRHSATYLSSNQGLNGSDHNVWLHVVINKINVLIVNYIFQTYAIDFFSPKWRSILPSFIIKQIIVKIRMTFCEINAYLHIVLRYFDISLPSQSIPSPVYPWLQLHVNEPTVLVQVASEWQLWASSAHSSTSTIFKF